MTELGWKLSFLKCKSLISSFTSLSTMKKFDCTQNILSLMWRCVPTSTWLSNIPLPQSIGCVSLRQNTSKQSALTLFPQHTTLQSLPCKPMFASIFALQVLTVFQLGQGSYALLQQQGKFFWESQWPSLYTWHSAQETESSALNSGSRFFFLPVSLLPQVYMQ